MELLSNCFLAIIRRRIFMPFFEKAPQVYKGRKYFKTSRMSHILSMLVFILFAVMAFGAYRSEGWSILSIALFIGAIITALGIIDSCLTFIELKDEAIEFRKNMVRKNILKSEIDRASWAKGCPNILVLKSGKRIELPEVEGNSITNSVNKWLKEKT